MKSDSLELVITADPVPLEVDANGVARLQGTRVTLQTVVAAFQDGATAEEIVLQYPSLELAQVYGVIAYYLKRRLEVEAYLEQWRTQADETKRQNESQFDPNGIRERLLARRAHQEAAEHAEADR